MRIPLTILLGLLVLGIVFFSEPALASIGTPNNDLDSYVIFALDDFEFKGGNDGAGLRGYVLGGNVGVNNARTDPNSFQISVGANGRFIMSPGTQLVADSIRLGEEATVYDVYRNYEGGIGWPPAINPQTGLLVVRGTIYEFTPPVISPFPDLCGDFSASTNPADDVIVPSTSYPDGVTLAPGTYRDLRVRDGNTLRLQAGTYTFRKFNTGQSVNIYTVPGTIIQIAGDPTPNSGPDFNLGGNGAYFGSEDPSVESVACICILGESTVQFSDNGEFWGVIKAPNANINLGRAFTHYGRFIGKTIGSDFNDNVTYRDCTPAEEDTTTLQAEKTASGSISTSYDWTIDKSVVPETWNFFKGDTGTSNYTITVTKSQGTVSTAIVEGQICVKNTGNIPTEGLEILDIITNSTGVVSSVSVDVSGKPVLNPGEEYCYPYSVDLSSINPDDDYYNKAQINITNYEGNAGMPFGIETSPQLISLVVTPTNAEIDVDDSDGGSWHFTDSGSVSYEKKFDDSWCGKTYTNRATIRDTEQYSEASVTVNCYDLEVTKDAATSVNRTYMWTIDKSADQSALTLCTGQQFLVNYEVKVDASAEDSDWKVKGNIYVKNPAPIDATINSISDLVTPDIAATVDCDVTFPYILKAGETLTCTYSASLPDGSTRTNNATASLQNYDYDYELNPTLGGTTDFFGLAEVNFAGSTVEKEIDKCVEVSDDKANPVLLGTVCYGTDTLPKTFSYSRYIGPYMACGSYTDVNTASFKTQDTGTKGTDSWTVNINVPCKGCTLTPGYWKTHSKYGPAPYDDTWALVEPSGEDSPFFSSDKTWYEVLWTPPTGGNAYYILAHAYIAAELNVLNQADPSAVEDTLAHAKELLSTYKPTDELSKKVRADFIATAEILDKYNNGIIGPGHCSE